MACEFDPDRQRRLVAQNDAMIIDVSESSTLYHGSGGSYHVP